MRLNKFIAASGVCSRRAADKMIADGKVKVNGKTVVTLGTEIDENNDTVVVDGKRLSVEKPVYIMFHKPKGCICSLNDEKGRKTIMDYLGEFSDKRIFPIGRLDYDTEGLIILTNDGEFANRLMHPAGEVPKTYLAKVKGEIEESDLAKLRNGIKLDDVKLRRCKIKRLDMEGDVGRYEITIFEGKNRQIHRMFESIGKEVLFLKRVKIGDLKLGGLSRGAYRPLTDRELEMLSRL